MARTKIAISMIHDIEHVICYVIREEKSIKLGDRTSSCQFSPHPVLILGVFIDFYANFPEAKLRRC